MVGRIRAVELGKRLLECGVIRLGRLHRGFGGVGLGRRSGRSWLHNRFDGAEVQQGGLLELVSYLLLVDPGHRNDDRSVVAGPLGRYLCLGDAEAVDTLTDDLDRLLQRDIGDLALAGDRLGRQDDLGAALEVQSEPWRV